MRTIKIVYSIVLYGCFLVGCAQSAKKQASMTVQEANTVMEELYKTVQYTDKESLQENPREFKFTEGKEQIPYYEETVSFEVEVPYSLKGWSESVDLSKEDPKTLLKEVEAYYLELASNITNKDIPAIAAKYYNKEKEIAQALFLDKERSKSRWQEDYLKNLIPSNSKVLDLKDYYLEFYGEGRVVNLLMSPGGTKPLAVSEKKMDGKYSTFSLDIYLHRPKPGAPLEMIR